jgi:replicative DNA helicase
MRDTLEARLLASVATVEDFEALAAVGVGPEDFAHYQPMYKYLVSVIQSQGRVPRFIDLKQTFNLPETVSRSASEFRFLLEEFRRLVVAQRLQNTIDKNVEEYGEDPDALLEGLLKSLMSLQTASQRHSSVTDQSMGDRLDIYAQRARRLAAEGMIGIPTGISHFDDKLQLGWLPGELVGLVGRTYIGKSWLLLYFGVVAWQRGVRVLFVSPEMPVEETEARFDALVMCRNDIKVDVSDLYRGYVPSAQMRELAGRVGKNSNWVTYSASDDGQLGLTELARLVNHYQPGLLLVDGLSLLESGKGRRQQVWESIKDISYGLKNLSVSLNIPTIICHQANRSAYNTARPPGLHEIAYGDDFARACDRVLALSRPQYLEGDESLRITIQKFRRGQPLVGGVDFAFDPGRGDIHELVPGDTNGHGGDGAAGKAGDGVGGALSLP